MRDALTSRDLQAVLRRYLACTGLTQEAAALLIGTDQGTVSKIFNGRRSRYTIEDVESFRDGFHIPGHLLGLQPGRHEHRTRAEPAQRGGAEPTKRRDFNKTVILAALGVSGAMGDAFVLPDPPRNIGMEHVRVLERTLQRLDAQDSLIGGDTLCEVAISLYKRGFQFLQSSSYPLHVGEALQSAVGELGALAGWLAYDADHQSMARHYFQETLLLARMNDDRPLEVEVLCSMILQSVRQQRPREAIQMARTAQRIASGWATPRLVTLLHLRAAWTHANMDNESAVLRELAGARNQLECGPHVDDPFYINFVTADEVAAITASSYLELRKPERASELYRSIIDRPDPAFRRNTSLYTVGLARARFHSGDVTQAAEIGIQALSTVSTVGSGRVRKQLHDLRNHAAAHARTTPKARDFVEHHDAAFESEIPHA